MKRKELIKRSLAAVMSATMGFSLLPGGLAVPYVALASGGTGMEMVNDTDTKNNPTDAGAYLDGSNIYMSSTDNAGIVLTCTAGSGTDDEDKSFVSDGYNYSVFKNGELITDDDKGEIPVSVDKTNKALTISTKNAKTDKSYSIKIEPTKGGTNTAADDDITFNLNVGYTVTYKDGAEEGVSYADTDKVKVYKAGSSLKVKGAGAVTRTGGYAYSEFLDKNGTAFAAGAVKAVTSDITLTPNWKKSVEIDLGTTFETANADTLLSKKYDGTKNWTAKIDGVVAAEENAKLPVVLSATLSDSTVANSPYGSTEVVSAIDDSVKNKDDYIVTYKKYASVEDKTVSIKVTPADVGSADVDLTGLKYTKVFDGTALTVDDGTYLVNTRTNLKNTAAKASVKIGNKNAEVDVTGTVLKDASGTDVTDDDAKNYLVGSYEATATLGDISDVDSNYDYSSDDVQNVKIPAEIVKNEVNVEFDAQSFGTDNINDFIENINPVTGEGDLIEHTVDVSSLTEETDPNTVAFALESEKANTKYNKSKFVISLDDPDDQVYFKGDVKYVDGYTPTTGSPYDAIVYKLNKSNIDSAIKSGAIDGKKVIGVNIINDDPNGNYKLSGHVDIVIVEGSGINVTFTTPAEDYGAPAKEDWYALEDTEGDSQTNALKSITTIKYYDESGNDVSDSIKKGVLDVPDANSIKSYNVDVTVDGTVAGKSYYGRGSEEFTVNRGTLKIESFKLDGEKIYYVKDETKDVEVSLVDPEKYGYVLDGTKEVKPTIKYDTDETFAGAKLATELPAPQEDTKYNVFVTVVGAGNYSDDTSGKLMIGSVTLTAEAEPEKIDIEAATVTGYENSYEATGEAIKPVIKVSYDGKDLVEGTDYSVEYGENKETSGTITITGLGDYKGTKTITFAITAKTDDQEEAKKAAADAAQKYIEAAAALPQTKDAVTDTAKADSDIAAAKALAPTEAQMALLDDETKAKVAEAAAQIANAEKAVADKKADSNKENEQPTPAPTPGTDTTTGSSTDVTPSNGGGSGSGGGGGSSNAKTVKNADGSTTTTTTTAKGTIETTTKTNADGSKTTSKVVKNKDGSGSVTETSVSAAGTTKVVEVVTDTTGAATEVTTTVSNSKGASMKVTYAAKGTAITVSKVETTGKTAVSIPATVKVGGKTYKVTKIAASALKGNKEITKVTLGKNVKAIGKNAFNGDSKLKTIVMKKAPTTVGKNAFKGIAKKATIKIKATAKAFKTAKKLIKKSGVASTVKIKRTK